MQVIVKDSLVNSPFRFKSELMHGWSNLLLESHLCGEKTFFAKVFPLWSGTSIICVRVFQLLRIKTPCHVWHDLFSLLKNLIFTCIVWSTVPRKKKFNTPAHLLAKLPLYRMWSNFYGYTMITEPLLLLLF